ncbi:MAG: hypothetical protein J5891_01415 [Spirochaetales bacterium]|nr:hypothetical protein [Spirochaetales bacterium]
MKRIIVVAVLVLLVCFGLAAKMNIDTESGALSPDTPEATTDEYVAALAEVDKDEIEELILKINGLILYNRIQMLNR